MGFVIAELDKFEKRDGNVFYITEETKQQLDRGAALLPEKVLRLLQRLDGYEQLMDIWDKTVREMTKYSAIVENAIDKVSEHDVPDILYSALTDDCIARRN